MPGEASYHFDNVLEDDDGDAQEVNAQDENTGYLSAFGAVLPR